MDRSGDREEFSPIGLVGRGRLLEFRARVLAPHKRPRGIRDSPAGRGQEGPSLHHRRWRHRGGGRPPLSRAGRRDVREVPPALRRLPF
eukprot:6098197-Alexandrium_andersonii.AAC.1